MYAILAIAIYLLPSIIAVARKMPNAGTIVVINILLGWTIIGWIAALAMSCGDSSPRGAQIVVQNNLAAGSMNLPTVGGTVANSGQRSSRPTWDPVRQSYLYQDPVTGQWSIQGADGHWLPFRESAQERSTALPPPQL